MSDNRHKNKNPPSISEQSLPPITFTDRDFNGINPVKQDDPMVVSIIIANFMVSKVFIDQGNSTDILKTLNELGAIVSMPHLKMKFPTLIGEIVTVKVDQKQARKYYVESLKVAPYPPPRELAKPHPIATEGTQVMSVDEGPPIQALSVYQANLDDEFDVDP
ncbi:hypothetical protein JHK86_016420 [Glycine max]|nr:hypothetical protein JHK86_016420 [Glycine max]